MEPDEIQTPSKGQPFSSTNRSKPYTHRRRDFVTGNWMGVFNILAFVYPNLKRNNPLHTRMTNNVCQQFAL